MSKTFRIAGAVVAACTTWVACAAEQSDHTFTGNVGLYSEYDTDMSRRQINIYTNANGRFIGKDTVVVYLQKTF